MYQYKMFVMESKVEYKNAKSEIISKIEKYTRCGQRVKAALYIKSTASVQSQVIVQHRMFIHPLSLFYHRLYDIGNSSSNLSSAKLVVHF